VIAGPIVWVGGASRERKLEMRKVFTIQEDPQSSAIVTFDGLERTDPFDVLIRADAGPGPLAMPGHHYALPNELNRDLLVIDFTDRHHPILRTWSRQRREAYVQAGWNVCGSSRLTVVDRFLALQEDSL
jgi:hypothetical protein